MMIGVRRWWRSNDNAWGIIEIRYQGGTPGHDAAIGSGQVNVGTIVNFQEFGKLEQGDCLKTRSIEPSLICQAIATDSMKMLQLPRHHHHH